MECPVAIPRLFLWENLSVTKSETDILKPSLGLYGRFLAQYLGPFKWQVAGLTLALFSHSALSVYVPQLLRNFIDGVLAEAEFRALMNIALIFLAAGLGRQITEALTAYTGESVAWNATNRLRTDLLTHAIRLDMGFFGQHPPGAMLERIDGDTNQLAYFFSQFPLRFLRSVLLLVGIVIALAIEDWRVCLAMFLFVLAVSVLLVYMRNFGVPYNERLRAATARLYGLIEERLSSLEDIKALGGIVHTLNRMAEYIKEQVYHGKRAYSLGNLMWPATIMIIGSGTGLTLAWGGYLVLRGEMTVGTVYLLFTYMNLMFWPLEDLSHQMEELQKAGGNLVRIQDLMGQRSTLADGTRRELGPGPVRICYRDVSFRYDRDGEEILKDVSFALEPGRTLGIVGRTGSGKTTIARLLVRLYDPARGTITLNGTDLREFRLETLRRKIGIVTQDVQFFSGTVRENLGLFDPALDDRTLEGVLARLNLLSWLQTLPEGLDTEVTSTNLSLSAGEAQRLALARIFLHDPDVVILDEAVARLDPATEEDIEQALRGLLQDRTGLVIAHRLKSIERVDSILVLENGQVQEYGTREALMADPHSHFNQLVALGLE